MNLAAYHSPGFLNPRHKSRKFFYSGASGCGKTTKAIADFLASNYDFKFVFSDEGQFELRTGAVASFTRHEIFRALSNTGTVCFNPSEMFEDLEEGFFWFCDLVYQFCSEFKGTKALLADEIQTYLPTHEAKWKGHPFALYCTKGRNRGADVFAMAPSVSDVNPKFRGQITDIFAFQQLDLDFAKHVVRKGIPLDVLTTLKPGEFCYWNKNQRGYKRGAIQLGKQ